MWYILINFRTNNLLSDLYRLRFCETGTVRDNRIGNCPLTSMKDMKKTNRGTYGTGFDFLKNVSLPDATTTQ